MKVWFVAVGSQGWLGADASVRNRERNQLSILLWVLEGRGALTLISTQFWLTITLYTVKSTTRMTPT